MKKAMGWAVALLTAVCLQPRLNHPAVDVGRLKPVELAWIIQNENGYVIKTDRGDRGTGHTLTEAARSLREGAPGEVILDTARYLLLTGEISDWETLCALFRPDAGVFRFEGEPDMETAMAWLRTHESEITLRILRTGRGNIPELLIKEGSGELVP